MQARAKRFLLGIYVFFTALLFRYFRPPPFSPPPPTLRLSSDGDTDRKRASDKQADDFIVVSNTHHDNYKVFLVIITEAPYNRMFANEKPVSQMVFSMPYRSLFD